MSKILQWLKSLGDNVFKYVYGCRYLNGGTENAHETCNLSHMEPVLALNEATKTVLKL